MPNKEISTLPDESALGILCTWLGQIPIGQQPIPKCKIPSDWGGFSSADWEQLVSKAYNQGLAPLMYWVLSKSGSFISIPESERNLLRAIYSGTWIKNQNIFKELEALAKAFKQASIQLVVLKGACVALTVYPDIGLRPMADLDVLIPGSKMHQAINVAKSLGFLELFKSEPEFSYLDHHVCLYKSCIPGIALELHEELIATNSYKFAVPMNWFWNQTEPMDSSFSKRRLENLLMLTPTAQVLYVATHAMLQHGGKDALLRWFYDLDRLIRSYKESLDWNLLLSQARIFNWGSALEAALNKTVACFETPIPEQVLSSLSGISDRNQQLVALKQIRPTTHLLMERQELLSMKSTARIRYLLALVVPSPAFMHRRYQMKSPWMIPLYYIIRWWDIIKDCLRSLISIFKKGSRDIRV